MRNLIIAGTFTALAQVLPAQASSTTTYSYDALGRLVATSTTGTVNNGVTSNTGYDPAGNRTTHAVAGAGTKVVVVPLNGYTVIPIKDE